MQKSLIPFRLVFLISACSRELTYPSLLSEADSAFVLGDYKTANILLSNYDHLSDCAAALKIDSGKKSDRIFFPTFNEEAIGNYRLLLELEQKFVLGNLTEYDFSAADSLSRYYDNKGLLKKHAQALLFLGDIYRLSADNPSALNCYLQAEIIGKKASDYILQAWSSKSIGDIYFDQRMFDYCKSYYRQYYQLAYEHGDTLRLVHGAQRMGKLYTIENNVDSTIFYYRQGIKLGRTLMQATELVTNLKANLSDVLIQIEEYEEALRIMDKDSANMFNWAFWYYGQHQADSAIYYFQKSSNLYDLQVRSECLEMLALLYAEKGDYRQSNNYYYQLRSVEDSLKIYSQAEETRRTNAQYNYNLIKQDRDSLAKKHRSVLALLISIVITALLLFLSVIMSLKRYREKKNNEILRERLQRQEEENRLKNSIGQIAENKRRINSLEIALTEAQQRNDELEARRLKSAAELLLLKNQQIENSRRQEELKLEAFTKTELYRKLKPINGGPPARLTEADWIELGCNIDDIYNNFTSRLTAMAKLSSNDLKLCYLTKLDIAPSSMASLLFLSKAAISLARRRMWKKLKGEEGTSAQLDAFIKSF